MEYSPPVNLPDRAGFIVFLDKPPVVFYTNDLASTPTARVLDGESSEAIACCHGLYPMKRWTGNEVMHRETSFVPAVVAAYNIAMNGVDRGDQLRSTNPARRKEMRLSMTLLTWALDLPKLHAFALMKHIQTQSNPPRTLRQFKLRGCESLTSAQRAVRKRKDAKRRRPEPLSGVVKGDTAHHVLTPNSTEHSSGKLVCYLCSLQGITSKSRFGCTQCLRGYHDGCFAVAHYKEAFSISTPSVAQVLEVMRGDESGNAPSKTRLRVNNSVTPLHRLTLPQ